MAAGGWGARGRGGQVGRGSFSEELGEVSHCKLCFSSRGVTTGVVRSDPTLGDSEQPNFILSRCLGPEEGTQGAGRAGPVRRLHREYVLPAFQLWGCPPHSWVGRLPAPFSPPPSPHLLCVSVSEFPSCRTRSLGVCGQWGP